MADLQSVESLACGLLGRNATEHEPFHESRSVWDGRGSFVVPPNVRMTIEWFVPMGQARPMTMALHSLAAEIRTAHGCVGCSVTTDLTNQSAVRYIEDWRTEDDLQTRLRPDIFAPLATLIEDATEAPRVEFSLPSGTRGLDYVEEVQRSFTRATRGRRSPR